MIKQLKQFEAFNVLAIGILIIGITALNFNFIGELNAQTANTLVKPKQIIPIFHQQSFQMANDFIKLLEQEVQKTLPQYQLLAINTNKISHESIKNNLKQNADCAITIGINATKKVLAIRSKTKIYSLQVPRIELDRFHQIYKKLNVHVTGIYQEQPFEKQIQLAKAINPNLNEINILLGQSDKTYLQKYKQTAQQYNLKLNYRILQPKDSSEVFFTQLVNLKDYFLLLNNHRVFNKSKIANFVLAAYYRQINLIGNQLIDTKNGALASVYTSQENLATETAQGLKLLCHNLGKPKPKFANQHTISVNHVVARKLQINDLNVTKLNNEISLIRKNKSKVVL